jgi:hypothetical protein
MHIASAEKPTCPHFSRLKLRQELKLEREVAEVAKARMQVKEEDEAEAKVAKEEAKVAKVAKVAKETKPRWWLMARRWLEYQLLSVPLSSLETGLVLIPGQMCTCSTRNLVLDSCSLTTLTLLMEWARDVGK